MSFKRPMPTVGDITSAAQRRADPKGWRFAPEKREALYEIIASRRDIRRFRPDGIDEEILVRILRAANAAPSVGLSQPWRFVLVTEAETRERASRIADRERLRQASLFDDDAGRRMRDLQLDGIREAPVGIVVLCERQARPASILGRATFPDADLWSCACAIENLWLAARAEGLGLGWVTFFPPGELAALVGAPDAMAPLGWLCIGWPDERPPAPGLERAAWGRREPVEHFVVRERWPDAPRSPHTRVRAPGPSAVSRARDDSDTLLTPPGSLGALDRVLDRLTALDIGADAPGALILAAADHPVARHGVSTYDETVTREVLEAAVCGASIGAAAAAAARLRHIAVDAGVAGDAVPGARAIRPRGARGDLAHSDALEPNDVERLIEAGISLAGEAAPADLVALGEVGIGNTTVASCLASALTGIPVDETIGLGASGNADTVEKKRRVIQAAMARLASRKRPLHPVEALAAVGGPELALLCGVALGVSARQGAIVLDGLATSVAGLAAVLIEPGVGAHLVAGQRSRERAHGAILDELGLEPLLDLRLRAGEGVGAAFAIQLLRVGLVTRQRTGRVEAT